MTPKQREQATGGQIISTLEAMLDSLPTNRVEIGTITDGLNCPQWDGRDISGVEVSVEEGSPNVHCYYANYYNGGNDCTECLCVSRTEAAFLLDIAARYFYYEQAEQEDPS